jgi:cytochrome P450
VVQAQDPPPLTSFFDSPVMAGDPFPFFKVLRATQPVARIAEGFWAIAKYDDVVRILRDPETFSSRVSVADERGEKRPPTILFDDPPVHTRMRGLLTKAFTPRVVELQREAIERNCERMVDAMLAADGPVDYVAGLSYPLPVGVIANMLGVADGDLATFKRWSDAIIENVGTALFQPENDALAEINVEFDAYFKRQLDKLRTHPQDNLLSALVHAETEDGRLSEEDLLVICRVLLVAGNETTTGLIVNAARVLSDFPHVLDRLRADLDLVPSFIEETLRYYPPFPATLRRTTRDVEIRGVTIPAGHRIIALLGSANRDEEAFERADEFLIDRDPNRHLAFGMGIHYCLGAPLARLEGQIAMRTLAPRIKRLRVVDAGEGGALRPGGPKSMMVEFERDPAYAGGAAGRE